MMPHKKSIMYVNFAPYENTGRVLDFLLQNFSPVVVFSFDFHKLNNTYQSNRIKIYEHGEKIKDIKLFKLPTPEFLLFISLPLIAVIIAFELFYYVLHFKKQFRKFDVYLTVNAFTAWIGNLFRGLKIVDKTIFWVWDYYPPGFPDWRVRLARFSYWYFDKKATAGSDRAIFLNEKLEILRKNIGALPKEKNYPIIPIGTNPIKKPLLTKTSIIGHLGVLKRGQGLDLLFDNLETLLKKAPDIKVEVIGSGPDEQDFKIRAKNFSNVTFYGFIKEEGEVGKIMRRWNLALATYIPNRSNESFWTDPSKMKAYISQGIPIITTSVTDFSRVITKSKAGIVIDYYNPSEFINAVLAILQNQKAFKNNALQLARKYNYKALYPKLFGFKTLPRQNKFYSP